MSEGDFHSQVSSPVRIATDFNAATDRVTSEDWDRIIHHKQVLLPMSQSEKKPDQLQSLVSYPGPLFSCGSGGKKGLGTRLLSC